MNPVRWLYVIVALIAVGAGGYGVWSYRHMAEQAAQLAPLRQELAALKQSYDTLAAQVVKRDELNAAIRQDRAIITKRLDDATKADPDVARYLGERIPDGVRRAYIDPPQR